jgi:hypothetical protein
MTWTPSGGPQNNKVSYDAADYRVTVAAEERAVPLGRVA